MNSHDLLVRRSSGRALWAAAHDSHPVGAPQGHAGLKEYFTRLLGEYLDDEEVAVLFAAAVTPRRAGRGFLSRVRRSRAGSPEDVAAAGDTEGGARCGLRRREGAPDLSGRAPLACGTLRARGPLAWLIDIRPSDARGRLPRPAPARAPGARRSPRLRCAGGAPRRCRTCAAASGWGSVLRGDGRCGELGVRLPGPEGRFRCGSAPRAATLSAES